MKMRMMMMMDTLTKASIVVHTYSHFTAEKSPKSFPCGSGSGSGLTSPFGPHVQPDASNAPFPLNVPIFKAEKRSKSHIRLQLNRLKEERRLQSFTQNNNNNNKILNNVNIFDSSKFDFLCSKHL